MKAIRRLLLVAGVVLMVLYANWFGYSRISSARSRSCSDSFSVEEAVRRGCPPPKVGKTPAAKLSDEVANKVTPSSAVQGADRSHKAVTNDRVRLAALDVRHVHSDAGVGLPVHTSHPNSNADPTPEHRHKPNPKHDPNPELDPNPNPGTGFENPLSDHPFVTAAQKPAAGRPPPETGSHAVGDDGRRLQRSLQNRSQEAGTGTLPWLAFGIPTVPRKGDLDYLTPTLQSIVNQVVQHRYTDKVVVYVINNCRDRPHVVFDKATDRFKSHPFIRFVTNPGRYQDNRTTFDRKLNRPNAQIPDARVRRQTLDVVAMLDVLQGSARHVLFYEDDFVLCDYPHSALLALQYLIDKATAMAPDWINIRCSFGMSGIIFQQRDLQEFRGYLYAHYNRRPPDHLVVEWYAGETPPAKRYVGNRRPAAFRWNILLHGGQVSSLRSARSGQFPGCFKDLVFPTVFEVEAFNPRTCPKDNVCVVDCCPAVCRCDPLAAQAVPFFDWGAKGPSHLRGVPSP
mmetsp:Transcript_97271/g.167637  ORF Transcript_97271/g.167637 Transcript_97271/m.167637 type:complete len:511 (-) Transcript_97271:367-1899(-)